jgi:hypothetical protein
MQSAAGIQFGKQQSAYNDMGGFTNIDGSKMSYQQALGANNPEIAKMSGSQFQEWVRGLSKAEVLELNRKIQNEPINLPIDWGTNEPIDWGSPYPKQTPLGKY